VAGLCDEAIDLKRKRIALSMRKDCAEDHSSAQVNHADAQSKGGEPRSRAAGQGAARSEKPAQGSLGAVLSEALRRK
jgi:uncharacterized protein